MVRVVVGVCVGGGGCRGRDGLYCHGEMDMACYLLAMY